MNGLLTLVQSLRDSGSNNQSERVAQNSSLNYSGQNLLNQSSSNINKSSSKSHNRIDGYIPSGGASLRSL
jgi:hypothetical protein